MNVDGPWTVFAPTNEAFAALPDGVLESLIADPAALTAVLLYHVAPGELFAADVVGLSEITMADGNTVDIMVNGGVKVNDANVIATDVDARNGVVHVIDAVLIPPMDGGSAVAAPGALKQAATPEQDGSSMGQMNYYLP